MFLNNFLPCNRLHNYMKIEKPFFTTFVLVFIFLPGIVLSQTDYAIRVNGDTVKGSLKILDYEQIDRVQVKTNKEKTTLTSLQVRCIKKNNELYRPVRRDNTAHFMKVLIDGYLSLNAFHLSNQSSWDGRYLTKLDGTGMEVPNLSFKKSLGNYLSDCEIVKGRIEKGELRKGDLEKIVNEYNACLQAKSQTTNTKVSPPVTIENDKTIALKNFVTKVEAENFPSKKDALDVLKDIQTKVTKNEPVPNYLFEGLKSYLLDTPSLNKDLEDLIALLKK